MIKNNNDELTEKDIKFRYVVLENDKELLVKGLLKRRIGISTRLMRKLKDNDGVFKNNIKVKMNEKVTVGDIITVCLPEEHSDFISEEIEMEVCYEDDDLLIVNKPAGIVVHPTKGHQTGTVANGIMHYMEKTNQSFKIRFINRLDKDTSGLLIIGKNSFSQDEISRQMEENNIIKKYIAIVKGHFQNMEGTIDLPIGQDEGDIRRTVNAEGYASVTHYKVLRQFEKEYSMVQLILETGRTHQIRVHLKYIGHPIVSDSLYGEAEPDLISRQALHAEYLAFNHPIGKQKVEVYAKIPKDIEKLIRLIG
jgi:23S rRNA pseudouridine1911/1915/1917 synthase